ncbi:hypothetical protein VCHENC02_4832, partial [Vibrio harveyi]
MPVLGLAFFFSLIHSSLKIPFFLEQHVLRERV